MALFVVFWGGRSYRIICIMDYAVVVTVLGIIRFTFANKEVIRNFHGSLYEVYEYRDLDYGHFTRLPRKPIIIKFQQFQKKCK